MKKKRKNDLIDKFCLLYNNRKWSKSKKVLLKLILHESNSAWLWTSLSSVTYELRDYKEALKYSKKAFKLNPKSPLVLWDHANVLYMLNKHKKARKKWEKILVYDVKEITKRSGFNLEQAKRLINDSRFRLGQSHFYEGEDSESKKYFKEYLKNRKRGISSLYKKKRAGKYLKEIDDSLAERK